MGAHHLDLHELWTECQRQGRDATRLFAYRLKTPEKHLPDRRPANVLRITRELEEAKKA